MTYLESDLPWGPPRRTEGLCRSLKVDAEITWRPHCLADNATGLGLHRSIFPPSHYSKMVCQKLSKLKVLAFLESKISSDLSTPHGATCRHGVGCCGILAKACAAAGMPEIHIRKHDRTPKISPQGFQSRSLTCPFHKVDVKHSDYKKYMFMQKPLCFTLSFSWTPRTNRDSTGQDWKSGCHARSFWLLWGTWPWFVCDWIPLNPSAL